jgi:mRNA-degrading endonuclease YafQ of YafQ-DinJ toxin-antitoxin module
MLDLIKTKSFKKSLKKYKGRKNILQELEYVVELLVNDSKHSAAQ